MALPLRQFAPAVAPRAVRCRTYDPSVIIVSLADARQIADDLWEGAAKPHTQWSVRQASIDKLHTLVYQLLADMGGRNRTGVAIGRCARPAAWTREYVDGRAR